MAQYLRLDLRQSQKGEIGTLRLILCRIEYTNSPRMAPGAVVFLLVCREKTMRHTRTAPSLSGALAAFFSYAAAGVPLDQRRRQEPLGEFRHGKCGSGNIGTGKAAAPNQGKQQTGA